MKNWLAKYKDVLIAISLTGTLIAGISSAVWAAYINPKIDSRVETLTQPLQDKMDRIEEELIFINCQFSVTLPDSLREEAEDLFEKAKRLGRR